MESESYHRSEDPTDEYVLALLHRAMIAGEQEAREWVLQCFGRLVLGWLHHHPNRSVACRLERDENYVTQAFERFWQATSLIRRVEFSSLAGALQFLRACLNGAILDSLRADARLREISIPEPGEAGEPYADNTSDSSEVWVILRMILPDQREQRLASLFFHCGLQRCAKRLSHVIH